MAKSPIDSRYVVWALICLFAILAGIGFSATLFLKISVTTGLIGIPLLVFGVVGIIVIRRKVSALKRLHPEFFKALGEDSATAMNCAICGAEHAFRFRCYYCKKYFCEKHKLPKNHHCPAAPKLSFRTVLLISPVMILVGTLILYISLLPSVMPPKGSYEGIWYGWFPASGALLIGLGMGVPIARAWEERRSKRAMDSPYEKSPSG